MREFTNSDWDCYGGAERFEDGSRPMMGSTPKGGIEADVILCGGLDPSNALVQLVWEQDGLRYFSSLDLPSRGIGLIVAESLEASPVTADKLKALGFETVAE